MIPYVDRHETRELPLPWVVAIYTFAFVLVCTVATALVVIVSRLISMLGGK